MIHNRAQGNGCGLLYGIAKCPGGNGRETDTHAAKPYSFFERVAIAAFQHLRLVPFPALSDRPHSVNHIACFELASFSAHRLTGRHSRAMITDFLTLNQQFRPGSTM